MTDAPKPNGKKKGGRPKSPPPPPLLGIAERQGPNYKLVIVLAGLKVNGKKYDPQVGAEHLAEMFDYCMRVPGTDPAEEMVAEARDTSIHTSIHTSNTSTLEAATVEASENGSH